MPSAMRRVILGLVSVAGLTGAAVAGPIGKEAPAENPPESTTTSTPVNQANVNGKAVKKANKNAVNKTAVNKNASNSAAKQKGAKNSVTQPAVHRQNASANGSQNLRVKAQKVAAKHQAHKAAAKPNQPVGVNTPNSITAGVQKWVEATLPGEQHESLNFFVGTWNADVKFSNLPGAMGASGIPASGGVTTTWTHGNRFLRSEYQGAFGGPNFTATGTFGFNNSSDRFEGTWMDSSSTGVRTSTGTADSTGKVFTFLSTFNDPMTGSKTTFKEVLSVDAPNQYTHIVYEVGANRSEHRLREVTYTRRR